MKKVEESYYPLLQIEKCTKTWNMVLQTFVHKMKLTSMNETEFEINSASMSMNTSRRRNAVENFSVSSVTWQFMRADIRHMLPYQFLRPTCSFILRSPQSSFTWMESSITRLIFKTRLWISHYILVKILDVWIWNQRHTLVHCSLKCLISIFYSIYLLVSSNFGHSGILDVNVDDSQVVSCIDKEFISQFENGTIKTKENRIE